MKIGKYFTTNNIIEGLFIAFLLTAFIYIKHFELLVGYTKLTINTLFGLFGLYRLLKAKPAVWFFAGFFLSISWLWWMAVSFYYYKMAYLIPIVVVAIGVVYGLLFLSLRLLVKKIAKYIEYKFYALFPSKTTPFLNALALLAINQFEPFGFNWLKLQLIFVESLLNIHLWSFALILFTLALFIVFRRYWLLLLLLLTIDLKHPTILNAKLLRDIELVSTNISIKEKWKPENRPLYTQLLLKKVDRAIEQEKKLIIFPESLLPYFLNDEKQTLQEILTRSKKITIVTGALYDKAVGDYRNSAYIFRDGNYTIANKVVLVPFGEANPLPQWMGKIVNKIFFDGSVDYKGDKEFTTIKLLNKEFKIAICYEGTSAKTYQDNPKYLIVISNNGWFKPSIEPTEQKLLLKFFSKLHKTTIYHSVNGSPSYVVVPHPEDL